jgi:hypothetical protein
VTIQISESDKVRCLKFAQDIINSSNQFNRFSKTKTKQIERTYIGKLAELMFLKLLKSNSIPYDEGDMFEIFEGQQKADSYDFITRDGYTIDIKTASKPFHSRIMVPLDQLHVKKDIYVGIKLNFISSNSYDLSLADIYDCKIFGYIKYQNLIAKPTYNFGEGLCKSIMLNELRPVQRLLKLF